MAGGAPEPTGRLMFRGTGMANTVVVGAQWGDEAKGKVVDRLAREAGMVVRYGGGNNAGHTVSVDGETYRFHLVPCGILYPEVTCVIADGVVIDPEVLVRELAGLRGRGHSVENLRISANAHVIMPYHKQLDALEEQAKGAAAIGTTGRGIGPAYADRAARVGIRMHELIDPAQLRRRIDEQTAAKNLIFERIFGASPLNAEAITSEFVAYGEALLPYVCDTLSLVGAAARAGNGIVFEGAQGTLLDLDLGTYPFVTSSHPIAGAACLGTGIGPTMIDAVLGVAKSYTTRVGAGVFPTELPGAIGDYIRERGNEYGTTTGRPRRCGWIDTVILRFSAMVNGLTSFALGHLDVLSGLEEIKLGVSYRTGGVETRSMPIDVAHRDDIEVVYETMQGWSEDLTGMRSVADLPAACRAYVGRIVELAETPVSSVSVGPAREQMLTVPDGWSW